MTGTKSETEQLLEYLALNYVTATSSYGRMIIYQEMLGNFSVDATHQAIHTMNETFKIVTGTDNLKGE